MVNVIVPMGVENHPKIVDPIEQLPYCLARLPSVRPFQGFVVLGECCPTLYVPSLYPYRQQQIAD